MFRDLPPFFERARPLISLPIYPGLTFLLRQCHGNHDLIHVISCHNLRHFMRSNAANDAVICMRLQDREGGG